MRRETAIQILDALSSRLVMVDWESHPESLEEVEKELQKLDENISFSPSLSSLVQTISSEIKRFKDGDLKAERARDFLTEALDIITVALNTNMNEEEIEKEAKKTLEKYSSIQEIEEETSNETRDYIPEIGEDDIDIVKDFLEEADDHLSVIEEKILNLESDPTNVDLINEIFRPFHSMKGAAGFLNFTQINRFCHEVETLLDKARKGEYKISKAAIDVLLESVDIIKALTENVKLALDRTEGKPIDDDQFTKVNIEATISKIYDLLSRKEPETTQSEEVILEEGKIGKILVDEGIVKPQDIKEALEEQQKTLGEILIEKGKAKAQDIEKALEKQQKVGGPSTIKVSSKKLDLLMEMVGELVIAFSLVERHSNFDEQDLELSKKISNLGKIVDGIQDHVLSLRMVPLKQTFQKLTRLVRDVSVKTGKKAKLIVRGEDTEVDKTVAEEIYDPLVHILRNSVDHGIEPPEERKRMGKPEVGAIVLNAYHWGGKVVIEIKDDGGGLKKDKILEKAIEKGIIDPEKELTDKEIYELIFAPGFSTAEKANDISGRGVGLDVVKKNVAKLGGSIEVNSTEGKGVTFTIKLPLTTAIVDGMIIKVGDQRFVIPTASIKEAVKLTPKQYCTVKGKGEMIKLRGDLISLIRLYKLFDLSHETEKPTDGLTIIVEGKNDTIVGLFVDDLIGQQRVVIKSLGDLFKDVKGVSGGVILGDGRVGLILDIDGLVSMAQEGL